MHAFVLAQARLRYTAGTNSHAADRVFRIAMVLAAQSVGACRTGAVIVTAELIAGHGASERREQRARMIRMPPVSSVWILVRETGARSSGIQRGGPRLKTTPGYAAAEPGRRSPAGCRKM